MKNIYIKEQIIQTVKEAFVLLSKVNVKLMCPNNNNNKILIILEIEITKKLKIIRIKSERTKLNKIRCINVGPLQCRHSDDVRCRRFIYFPNGQNVFSSRLTNKEN